MTESLQDILRRRQQEEFVGREEQLTLFYRNLRYKPSDDRRRFIVSISGQGGVGKTWLLRRFRKMAEEAGVVTACTDEAEDDVTGVMGRIAEQFKVQGHPLKTFAERYKVYHERWEEIEADPAARSAFPTRLGRAITRGSLTLARIAPGVSAVAELLDEEPIVDKGGEFAAYVARKVRKKEDVHLVLEPVEVLTPLFLTNLREVAERCPTALFFDTYERTGNFLDPWLRDLLEGRHGDVPANILLVVAGRDELDRNQWAPYEGLLVRLPLEPFTEVEARDYLARKGITDERVVEVILSLSGRLPLLVATLAAESPDDPHKVGDPSGEAVERFLKWVEDPKRRHTALDAALPRFLNCDVLAVLVGNDEADALFAWLQGMPFVEKRGGSWAYHGVVRAQMLRYKRQESPKGWASLHERLAEYYEGLRNSLGVVEEKGRRQETWQRYELEVLYHRLCQSPQGHLSTALRVWPLPEARDVDFARRRAQTICAAGTDVDANNVHQQGLKRLRLIEAVEKNDHETVLELLTVLLADGVLSRAHRADALAGRGVAHKDLGDFESALVDFEQALESDPDHVWAFVGRGATYRLMQRYDDALADLNRAVELAPDDAWIIATRADTYRLMKRYEAALADFNRAIDLDPGYVWAIRHRGDTYRQMRRYDQALTDLNRAIELGPEHATNFGGRGIVYQQMRQYDKALIDLNRAIELQADLFWAISNRGETHRGMKHYQEALVDLDRAIELAPWYDWQWVDRGMTFLSLKRYDDAISDFNEAIRLNSNSDRAFFGRGLTHHTIGQNDKARTDLQAAIQIVQQKRDADPWDWRNPLRLARYHLALGEAEQAERLYRKILPGKVPAYRARTAAADLEDFLALFPTHSQARALKGIVEEYLREASR